MFKFILLLLLGTALHAHAQVSKTTIDLMNEGRFREARTILDTTPAGERYRELLTAMMEPDGVTACGLYYAIAQKYPGTDCDSVAQDRLRLAAEIGLNVEEIVEVSRKETPQETTIEPVHASQKQTAVIEPMSSASLTIDYEVDAEKNSATGEIIQTNATPEQQLVKNSEPEKVEEPKIKAVTMKPTEPVKTEELVIADITPIKAPTSIPVDKPALESSSSSGVKPVTDPNLPHDLESDSNANGEWYVQVGAFGNHDNAYKLAAEIRSFGYRVILVPRASESGELLQVRVGGYQTIEESREVAVKLKTDFSVPAAVVNK